METIYNHRHDRNRPSGHCHRPLGQGLVFDGITKAYGRTLALKDVSFAVAPGTVHALVGENGAGKSTLMRILAGMVRPDRGTLRWRGAPLECPTPREALDRGVGIVPQEPVLFPNLTVAENVFAGREPSAGTGRIKRQEMRERTAVVLRDLHASLEPDAPVDSLGPAQQQLVQIARALAFSCQVLILDEPTTCLTDAEVAHLEAMLHRLRAQGVTMLYVSHRLAEVFRLSDARDGAARRRAHPHVANRRGDAGQRGAGDGGTRAVARSSPRDPVRRPMPRWRWRCPISPGVRCSRTCRCRCARARSSACSA